MGQIYHVVIINNESLANMIKRSNKGISIIQPATQVKYNKQFELSYTNSDKHSTYRLRQVYYVSPFLSMDFRKDKSLKQTTDQEVDEKIIYRSICSNKIAVRLENDKT